MQIIGCDLHTRQQTLAIMDTETGELAEKVLGHEASNVRNFYSTLPGPVRVGIEATGSMPWFLNLMEELGIECQVGHPAKSSRWQTVAEHFSPSQSTCPDAMGSSHPFLEPVDSATPYSASLS